MLRKQNTLLHAIYQDSTDDFSEKWIYMQVAH